MSIKIKNKLLLFVFLVSLLIIVGCESNNNKTTVGDIVNLNELTVKLNYIRVVDVTGEFPVLLGNEYAHLLVTSFEVKNNGNKKHLISNCESYILKPNGEKIQYFVDCDEKGTNIYPGEISTIHIDFALTNSKDKSSSWKEIEDENLKIGLSTDEGFAIFSFDKSKTEYIDKTQLRLN